MIFAYAAITKSSTFSGDPVYLDPKDDHVLESAVDSQSVKTQYASQERSTDGKKRSKNNSLLGWADFAAWLKTSRSSPILQRT